MSLILVFSTLFDSTEDQGQRSSQRIHYSLYYIKTNHILQTWNLNFCRKMEAYTVVWAHNEYAYNESALATNKILGTNKLPIIYTKMNAPITNASITKVHLQRTKVIWLSEVLSFHNEQ